MPPITKVKNFEEERKQVLQKMFDILGITETNKMFSLKELDASEKKQNEILALEPDIKEYFAHASWTCFKKPCKRRFLSFIKYVMKDMDVNMKSAVMTVKFDDSTSKSETYYKIIPKNK